MSRGGAEGDYDYIIRVIQYLDRRHGMSFFIDSRDFDVLYRWWEKRIPDAVVREAIDRAVARGRRLGRPARRIAAFAHEVRQAYRSFLSLNVGRAPAEPEPAADGVDAFLEHLPTELESMREGFADFFRRRRDGESPEAAPLEDALLARFRDDGELNAKSDWFLKNLAPALRRPAIERRYRLNYLWGRFGIPPLE